MRRRTKVMIHLGFWWCLFFFAVQFRVLSFEPLTYESGAMVLLLAFSLTVNAGVVYTTALLILPPFLRKQRRLFWSLVLGMTLIIGAGLKILFTSGLFRIFDSSSLYEDEPMLLFFTFFTTLLYAILGGTYRFAMDWIVNEAQRRALEHQKTVAELGFLKSQINPHFLFNALNNLYGLAHREAAETTAQGIIKLADMMRYMLYECEEGMLPLRKELDYLHNYIDLQRLRAPGDHVRIHFEVDGEVDHLQVHPLLMVPLVENAFKHGISAKTPCAIDIRLKTHATGAELQVSNTIHTRQYQDPKIGGTGLENLTRRLSLIDPERERLTIHKENGQFRAILALPGMPL